MMGVPCCKKCEQKSYCRPYASCCLECHFAFEIKNAAPYLSPQEMAWLRGQHAMLKRLGYPADLVNQHAIDEMRLFRKKCPAWVVELIDGDHDEYERGNLPVRDM